MKNKLIAVSVLAVLALAGYIGKDTATAEVAQEQSAALSVATEEAAPASVAASEPAAESPSRKPVGAR